MMNDELISDDDLLLYYYRDGLDKAAVARIEGRLSADPALARRFRVLSADLAALQASGPASAPDPARRRWQQALRREAQLAPAGPASGHAPHAVPGWAWSRPWLGPALAALVFMSFGIGLGRWIDSRPGPRLDPLLVETVPDPAPAAESLDRPAESRLIRGVGSHLAATGAVLDELQAAEPTLRQDLLNESIARNRMYAAAAEAQGDAALARVLRAFDSTLQALASERAGNGSFAADRAQLEFELRIMQTKLASAASKPAQAL